MGKDSPWRFSGMNCTRSNRRPPDIGQQRSTNSMVFPTYANPFGCAFPGNAAVHKFHGMNSASLPPLPPNPLGFAAAAQKRFIVFDQLGDRTNLIFSSMGSPSPYPSPINPGADLPWSDETDVCDGGEEMHEDTEEIDALLYSDSDDDREEEEASTGHSPPETTTVGSMEEAASSSAVPAKRRRVDTGLDASLVDTASSAGAGPRPGGHEAVIAKSSWAEPEPEPEPGDEHDSLAALSCGSKRRKRERIQETVGVLRRIIPGGRGKDKDAATVLDEAIRYLRSLKLKAKALGNASIL